MTPTWNDSDLDQGTDDGVVHESTPNTGYDDANEIRKGDPTAAPLYAADLVAWYPLQESSSGAAHDFSGNDYDGTVSGATQGGGDSLTGLPSYSFDGVDDFVEVTDGSEDVRTVSLWINSDTAVDGTNNFRMPATIGTFDWLPSLGRITSKLSGETITLIDPGLNGFTATDETIAANVWTHLAFRWNGSYYEIYINGSEVGNYLDTTGGLYSLSVANLYIGARQSNSDGYYDGDIADFRIYNRAISASEIQELYGVFAKPSTHKSTKKQL